MRKGSLMDLPFVLVMLLSGALTIFVVYLVISSIYAAWPASMVTSRGILQRGLEMFTIFDYMFLVFAVSLGMFTVVAAFFVESHPIFFIFSFIIMLPIVILTSAQITNVFDAFATSTVFTAVSNQFPMIVIFMRNLPLFMLSLGSILAILMYAKPGGGKA